MHVRQAGLIICYAGTGRTASLIAKYRPTVPILALVVPHLKSKGLSWELEGRSLARQFQVMRGGRRPHQSQPALTVSPLVDGLSGRHALPTCACLSHGR